MHDSHAVLTASLFTCLKLCGLHQNDARPEALVQSQQPESQMIEAVIYVSSAVLTMCTTLVELGSCEAQHFFVNKCKSKEELGHSSVSLDRGEQDEYSGAEFI